MRTKVLKAVDSHYVCSNCGHETIEYDRYIIYRLTMLYFLLHRHQQPCSKCRIRGRSPHYVKADFRDEITFDILSKEKDVGEDECLPTLLTWVCGDCAYSWDTTEIFKNSKTKEARVKFIQADKRCPSCRSDDILLFSEKEL